MQALDWGFPVERFAWAAVELGGDGVEVCAGVDGQVGALEKVLPDLATAFERLAALPRPIT